jgi:hypothetical protein
MYNISIWIKGEKSQIFPVDALGFGFDAKKSIFACK